MSRRGARFNGAVIASAGLALTYERAWATVNAAGQACGVNVPCYEAAVSCAAPPTMAVLSTTTNTSGWNNLVGCGTWSDGSPATIQYFSASGAATPRYLAIRVNRALTAGAWDTFTGLPTAEQRRCIDIGHASGGEDVFKGSGAAFGEDSANFRHRAINGIVVQGLAIITGDASAPGATPKPHGYAAKWNEEAGRLELLYRTPAFNTGALAVAKGNSWVRPHVSYLGGVNRETALEAWLCWNTYDVTDDGNDRSGTVFVARLHRDKPSDVFDVDAVVELVWPTYDTTSEGGGTGTHIHDSVVVDWGNGGMAVVVLDAHDLAQTQHIFFRNDRNYTQGWAPTAPAAPVIRQTASLGATVCNPATVTPAASKVDGATQNGWTTRRYAAGDITTSPALFSPQYMSIDLTDDPAMLLVGSDESVGPISMLRMPATTTDKFTAERCQDTGYTSFGSGWNAWTICRPNPTRMERYAATRCTDNITSMTVPNIGGTTWTNRNAAMAVIFSHDGRRWTEIYRATDSTSKPHILGWHGPDTVIVGVNNGSNHQLRAITVPRVIDGSPAVVTPGGTTYAQSTVAFGSFGGTNTMSDVTATYQTPGAISAGRTIPPCPSNGRVLRATGNSSSNVICADVRWNGSSTKEIPLASDKLRVGFWVYLLPTKVGWSSNAEPPYNSFDQLYFGFRVEDSSGSPITGQLNSDMGRVDASGWHYITREFEIDATTQLTAAALVGPVRFYVRLMSGSSARYIDALICCDHIVAGATSSPPTIAPPVGASPTTYAADKWELGPFAPGANWSAAIHLQASRRGWDSYNIQTYRATRRVFTLVQSGGGYIACSFDAALGRFTFTNGTTSAVIAAQSGEFFEVNRLSPITIGITKTDAGGGNSTMAFYVAVGGSRIGTTLVSGSLTWNTSDVRPTKFVLADASLAEPEGIMCHSFVMEDAAALNATDMAALMASGFVPTSAGRPRAPEYVPL